MLVLDRLDEMGLNRNFFLDMDGTILDLAFDNYFWHDHIPILYSKKNKISFNKAKIEFEKNIRKENTIEWYSLKLLE